MRQTVIFLFLAFLLGLCFTNGQQYVPIPVYIPTIVVNQTYPRPPSYNYPNSYNSSYGYGSNYNYSASNSGYRPLGSYVGNQFPSYPNQPNYYQNQQNHPNHTRYNNSNNLASSNGTQDGHLFLGQIQLYDKLLFNQVYRKERRWWSSREKVIEYPAASPAGYTRHEIISAIRIYNQYLDGNSARASILKGGPGSQYVKIRFESDWNKGFQFLVQIYGH